MKEKAWVNPNRMLMESGHKTFDRQTNCISTGNMIANTQLSSYVRPYSKVECNGRIFPLGHLRKHDLGWWSGPLLPSRVRAYIESVTKDEAVIVYQFHHFLSGGYWGKDRRIVHGYVVTTTDYELLKKFVTGPTYKSSLVIDEATKYITN